MRAALIASRPLPVALQVLPRRKTCWPGLCCKSRAIFCPDPMPKRGHVAQFTLRCLVIIISWTFMNCKTNNCHHPTLLKWSDPKVSCSIADDHTGLCRNAFSRQNWFLVKFGRMLNANQTSFETHDQHKQTAGVSAQQIRTVRRVVPPALHWGRWGNPSTTDHVLRQ